MDAAINQQEVEVNGIRLAYLQAGEGSPVVLLHGFPDDAWTWTAQIRVLAAAGYRALAPFLRGFPPTEVPRAGGCHPKKNAADLTALLRNVCDEPAYVVGHDWGGLATYGTIAAAPELVRRAAVVAVSHPATLLSVLENPALVHHLFHVWFFLVEDLSEAALRASDFALLDYLWEYWTRPGHEDAAHVARLKREVFTLPGVVEALAGYYRALVRLPETEPEFVADVLRPTTVPMLSIWGREDPGREAASGERQFFQGEYDHHVIANARHFVHREQPEAFNDVLLSWIGGSDATVPPVRTAREPRAVAPQV